MSLLMPEYERHLRGAVRRLAGNVDASPPPPRGVLGARPFLAFAGALPVAVALAAIVLVGHRGSPTGGPGATPLPSVQYDCPGQAVLGPVGRLVAIAHGTVGGQRWTLEADSGRRGIRSVQAGRLLLGGRAYGFCQTRLDVELVNAGAQGVVYGVAAAPYRPPIVIEATTAHGTRAHPVPANEYPAIVRRAPGAVLFVRALPASACAYRRVAVAAPQHRSGVGRSQTVLGIATFTRSCAPGQLRQTDEQGSGPRTPPIPSPAGRSPQSRAV